MKKFAGIQLWVAVKIWMTAVFINTILGTLYLTDFFAKSSLTELLILYGLFFGTIVSFPVFIILFIIINRSVSKNNYGKMIFLHTLTAGVIMTAVAFFLFLYWFQGFIAWGALFACAIISGVTGISCQYKSLIRLERGDGLQG